MDPSGRITTDMLDLYLEDHVRAMTDGQQHPVMNCPILVPDFPIALASPSHVQHCGDCRLGRIRGSFPLLAPGMRMLQEGKVREDSRFSRRSLVCRRRAPRRLQRNRVSAGRIPLIFSRRNGRKPRPAPNC